jgi:hypothetical protein
MQFSQLQAPDSLLMGIETFVLIRQETRWGREETWMWRRRRRVPNRTRKAHLFAAQIYNFFVFVVALLLYSGKELTKNN